MKTALKIILGCLGILILGIGLFAGLLFFVFRPDEMCGNHFVESKLSPNKKLKLIIFYANCGTTTSLVEERRTSTLFNSTKAVCLCYFY